MATKKKPSKFQAVSEFFAANPNGSTDDAVKAAAKLGLDVGANYVRQIRSKTESKSRPKKKRKSVSTRATPKRKPLRAKPQASARKVAKAADDPVLAAVRFIREIGGVQQARKAMTSAEAILAELDATDGMP